MAEKNADHTLSDIVTAIFGQQNYPLMTQNSSSPEILQDSQNSEETSVMVANDFTLTTKSSKSRKLKYTKGLSNLCICGRPKQLNFKNCCKNCDPETEYEKHTVWCDSKARKKRQGFYDLEGKPAQICINCEFICTDIESKHCCVFCAKEPETHTKYCIAKQKL